MNAPQVHLNEGPTRDDVAAFRAYLDGIAPRLVVARYGARYLEHEPSAHRILSTIRRTLITALRLHQRHHAVTAHRATEAAVAGGGTSSRCVVAAVARPSPSHTGADGSG